MLSSAAYQWLGSYGFIARDGWDVYDYSSLLLPTALNWQTTLRAAWVFIVSAATCWSTDLLAGSGY
jgi:hypothetical protein